MLKDGVLRPPHLCPPQVVALVGLLRTRSFFPGRCNKPGVRVWLSAYFPPRLLPHFPRPIPPCLVHLFTPMSLAFAAFFQLPIIVQELGSYLLFIYKYRNIKETLSSSLPVSPTTLYAASPVSALKVVCRRGLIWGWGFGASWILFLLGLLWPFCQLCHCPVPPSPWCKRLGAWRGPSC